MWAHVRGRWHVARHGRAFRWFPFVTAWGSDMVRQWQLWRALAVWRRLAWEKRTKKALLFGLVLTKRLSPKTDSYCLQNELFQKPSPPCMKVQARKLCFKSQKTGLKNAKPFQLEEKKTAFCKRKQHLQGKAGRKALDVLFSLYLFCFTCTRQS